MEGTERATRRWEITKMGRGSIKTNGMKLTQNGKNAKRRPIKERTLHG